MGHHHHHHGHHHHAGRRLGLGGPPGQISTGWPLVLALAAVLVAYGAFDGIATYRIYFHGEQGMGVVTTLDERTNSTLLSVQGQVCAISGHVGRVGGMLPVAYPPGRPGSCVVRQMSSFRWPAGALIAGLAIIAGIVMWRRGALSSPDPQS
jgi:hypothetical protein